MVLSAILMARRGLMPPPSLDIDNARLGEKKIGAETTGELKSSSPPAHPDKKEPTVEGKLPLRKGKTHAIVIGANTYKHNTFIKLNFVKKDVTRLAHMLRSSYGDENVTFLSDKGANAEAIKSILVSYSKKLKRDDTIIFYYAGHASSYKSARRYINYLSCYNTDPKNLEETSISFTEIKSFLSDSIAKRMLVVLDACYTGEKVSTRYVKALREIASAFPATTAGKKQERAILSTNMAHSSLDLEAQSHSIFTKHFIEALKGGAADNENIVRVRNLYNYLQGKLEEETEDTPEQVVNLLGAGDFPILVATKKEEEI